MRCILICVIFLTNVPVVAAPAPLPRKQKPAADDLIQFQGQWELVREGKDAGNSPTLLRIKDRRLSVIENGQESSEAYDLTINQRAWPKEIDLTRIQHSQVSARHLGIYRLEGEKLTILVRTTENGNRPTHFDSNSDAHRLVLRRIER